MSDTTAPTVGGAVTRPPLPTVAAADAAHTPAAYSAPAYGEYASDFLPAPSASVAPVGPAAATEPAPAKKPRKRVLVAIIGGGVLAVALIFGSGMWAGWAIGQSQVSTFDQSNFPGSGSGGFGGQGGSGSDQGTVPNRQDGSDSSSGSGANS